MTEEVTYCGLNQISDLIHSFPYGSNAGECIRRHLLNRVLVATRRYNLMPEQYHNLPFKIQPRPTSGTRLDDGELGGGDVESIDIWGEAGKGLLRSIRAGIKSVIARRYDVDD
jgi:hypothetical protein